MEETKIKNILERYRMIAVIGISRQKNKDSHIVAEYRIIPINPLRR